MKIQGIYAIRNTVSGRVYVGSSTHIAARWNAHKQALAAGKHASYLLQRAWGRHGAETFVFSILEVVELRADLIEREQAWIDALRAAIPAHGFNLKPSAGTMHGYKHTEQAKERARIAQTRAWADEAKSENRRRLQTIRMIARHADPKERSRMGAWMKTDAGAEWIKGRNIDWWSDEKNREEMRRKAKERCTPEFIAKCRAAGMGKQSPKHRAEHVTRLRARMANPAEVERIREALISRAITKLEADVAAGKEISRGRRAIARKHIDRLSPAAAIATAARKAPNGMGKKRFTAAHQFRLSSPDQVAA